MNSILKEKISVEDIKIEIENWKKNNISEGTILSESPNPRKPEDNEIPSISQTAI